MYRFKDEQTAIDAEQWIVDKAEELGIPFTGSTTNWAIPWPEIHENEPTGKWLFAEIPDYTLEVIPQEVIDEFFNTFNAEVV